MDGISIETIAKRDGYQKYRSAAAKVADYQATYDDRQLIVVASTADVVITLPQQSLAPGGVGGYTQVLEIVAIGEGDNHVIIKAFPGDTFSYGNTEFRIPHNSRFVEIGLAHHGHFLRREIIADLKLWLASMASISIESTYTTIPFDTEVVNNQPEFYTNNNGEVTVLTKGEYDVTGIIAIDSAGTGGRYNVWARLHINGNPLSGTELRTGNYPYEDSSMTGVGWSVPLNAGDVVTLKAKQTALQGQLLNVIFALRLRVG